MVTEACCDRVKSQKKVQLLAQIAQTLKWDHEEEDADDKRQKKKEEKKEKAPPPAKDLFKLVYDDVEERHVAEFGIQKTDVQYQQVLELLKLQTEHELKQGLEFTKKARGMDGLKVT